MKIRSVFVSATLACVAGIIIAGCGNSFSGTDDSAEDTSAVVTEESDALDPDIAPQASVSGPLLELSGSPADVIHVDEDSYYEAERFFLFAAILPSLRSLSFRIRVTVLSSAVCLTQ